MKRPLLTHSAWGITALAAFVIGRQFSQPSDSRTGKPEALRPAVSSLQAQSALQAGGVANGVNRSGAEGEKSGNNSPPRPLTPAQMEALAKEALNDPNPLTRSLAFAKLLESMTPENVQQIMESMKTNRAGGDQWQLFSYAWGALDGAAAIAHADTLEGRDKSRFLSEALTGWAGKNPAAATAWLDALPEGEDKNRFRGSLVGGLADKDTGMATSYVYERAKAGDRQAVSFLETVAGEELRKNGPAAAAAWGEGLPDGELKGAALDRIAGSYVQENPEAAAAWAAKFASTPHGAGAVEEVGEEWAERNPKAAVAWLDSLAEGRAKAEGTHSAFSEWTRRDPVAASEHLAAMPPSASKDSAVSGFARSLAGDDPESAVIWAKTITDEKSRVQTLTRTGQAWFRRDPAAASTWLQTAGLPAEALQAITDPPRDRRGRPRG